VAVTRRNVIKRIGDAAENTLSFTELQIIFNNNNDNNHNKRPAQGWETNFLLKKINRKSKKRPAEVFECQI